LLRRRVDPHPPQGLLEVTLRVDLVLTAVGNESVEQRTGRTCLGVADEEVVLQPKLRPADEVLNGVVVDVETAFDQAPAEPSRGRPAP